MSTPSTAKASSPWTLLARGENYVLVGTGRGNVEVQSAVVAGSLSRTLNKPRPAQNIEHCITRVADVGGEKIVVNDMINLRQYRAIMGIETLECECAFDEIEAVWYVRM